jgi:hypothetical protein
MLQLLRRMLCILRESNFGMVSDESDNRWWFSLPRANCLEGNYPTVGPRMLDEEVKNCNVYIPASRWLVRASQQLHRSNSIKVDTGR